MNNKKYNENAKYNETAKYITEFDSYENIEKLLVYFIRKLENFDEVKDALNYDRKQWRNKIIEHERELIDILKTTDSENNKVKILITDAIVNYSDKLTQIAEIDFTLKKTTNPILNLIYYFIKRFDLDGKKHFWIDTLDMQTDILKKLLQVGIPKEYQYKVCSKILNNCDILLAGLHRESKTTTMKSNAKSDGRDINYRSQLDFAKKAVEIRRVKKIVKDKLKILPMPKEEREKIEKLDRKIEEIFEELIDYYGMYKKIDKKHSNVKFTQNKTLNTTKSEIKTHIKTHIKSGENQMSVENKTNNTNKENLRKINKILNMEYSF